MSQVSRASLAVWAMALALMVVGMNEVVFPWEALATLMAGASAVIGAVVVASKQMAISKGQNAILKEQAEIARRQADILEKQVEIAHRQTGILDKQVNLESLSIKGELFDRRYEVFLAAQTWLRVVINRPNEPHVEEIKRFKEGLDKAKFLFGKNANERLRALSIVGIRFPPLKHRLNAIIADGKDPEQRDIDEVLMLEKSLRDKMYNLADVFGPELAVTNDPFVFKEDLEPITKYWLTGKVDPQEST